MGTAYMCIHVYIYIDAYIYILGSGLRPMRQMYMYVLARGLHTAMGRPALCYRGRDGEPAGTWRYPSKPPRSGIKHSKNPRKQKQARASGAHPPLQPRA